MGTTTEAREGEVLKEHTVGGDREGMGLRSAPEAEGTGWPVRAPKVKRGDTGF